MLNPLGVPSRMNVGQILETHMGWAARGLGKAIDAGMQEFRHTGEMAPLKEAMKVAYGEDVYNEAIAEMPQEQFLEAAGNVTAGVPIATPVFDGAKEADVNDALQRAGFDTSGQSIVHDGRTGEQFARPVTVGVKYLLKLHHLVDDKIHARSTGPTASSPSSRWAARRSSAASASARWRSGRWKPTAPPTPCRRC